MSKKEKIRDVDKEAVSQAKKAIKVIDKENCSIKSALTKVGLMYSRFNRVVNRYAFLEEALEAAKEKHGKKKNHSTDAEKKEKSKDIFASMRQGLSLRKACMKADINWDTFLTWVRSEGNDEISRQYDAARMDLVERDIDRIRELAEKEPAKVVSSGAEGSMTERIDPGDIQNRRLAIDTFKWYVSKMAPKLYGDKTIISGDEDNPVKTEVTQITRRIVRPGDKLEE